ncbi:glycoside hydrolase family 105 protein [Sphingobacterium sp. BN32]|uniref:glycoside hydrolase family 88/105 protein n=1 Tax=Sphingobacterium sp. BN32 TaxID=3058432 RepID=UPI00265D3607|nr:glycoside hydrolase family 88 protein [Sphingobacterium sp. BN32]WKK59493.1 glycoside hydrolase family 88 protein [Sphingobacterium sp. BN32]
MRLNIRRKTLIGNLLACLLIIPFLHASAQRSNSPLYEQIALSEMKRFPELWQLDHGKRLYFAYSQGLGALAFYKLYEKTKNEVYFNYVETWMDSLIGNRGEIYLYKPEDFHLDFINPGKLLFLLYEKTKKDKYALAIEKLMDQLRKQPRTADGLFWHKDIYPHQVWLDGLYMAAPFLTSYAKYKNEPKYYEEALNQILGAAKHLYDRKTGLYYHAWDALKVQPWANPKTGQSPNFWGRSIGWWFMALVDVLDDLPKDNPRRDEVRTIIDKLATVLPKYQDNEGLFWQVLDKPNIGKNYQEASVNSMFLYAYAKAVNKGYIEKGYRQVVDKLLAGLQKKLLVLNADGLWDLHQCNAVAGLGGSGNRDGSFEYYVNERIRSNDIKATAPLIMGLMEMDK